MSQTRTMVKGGFSASRPHDHLYDPVYTVSNGSEHAAAHQRAVMATVERIPAGNTMFSDVPHYPRHSYRLSQSKHTRNFAVPAFPPQGSKARIAADSTVLGQQRTKFFKRPIVPFLQSVPAEVLLAPVTMTGEDPMQEPEMKQQSKTRTVGSQSMYRESEAQTDPFTPDYITNPGQQDPEILELTHMKWGQGLPASLEEIKLIHRMREKRAFEASLPPITDDASFELRKKMLKERELKEWAIREEEMKQEQEDRLQILIETLRKREEATQALSEARIDKVRNQKLVERDLNFDAVQAERVQKGRSLLKNRPPGEPKSLKRDIIEEHSNHGSKVYVSLARDGRLPLKNQVVDYGIPLTSSYQGLSSLEACLPKSITDTRIKPPKKIIPVSAQGRRGHKYMAELDFMDNLIEEKKNNLNKPKSKFSNIYKQFEPITRAPTPGVTAPADEEAQCAILMLQRLLRGRAVQNMMYEGKQKAIHLIRELRVAEEPMVPLQPPSEEELQAVAVDTVQGEVMSKALDFIAKEVVRTQEEMKIAEMVRLARRTRRLREAEEAGRRQAEDILRAKQEEYFSATMNIHQQTASRFLDFVLENSVEQVADQSARRDAALLHNAIGDVVDGLEAQNNTDEQIAADLVSSFLLPEVVRQQAKRESLVAEQRHHDAAHRAVFAAVAGAHQKASGKPLTVSQAWVEEGPTDAELEQASE